MSRLSFTDALALVGLISGPVLVALDKGGRLKGGVVYGLLAVAAAMTVPLALGNAWVTGVAPGPARYLRGTSMLLLVGALYMALAAWVTPGLAIAPPSGRDAKGPCRPENGKLVDCTDAELVDWGKPLMGRLDEAVRKTVEAAQRRLAHNPNDHDKLMENITLNRYLEGEFDNLGMYRAALVSQLKGGDPSGPGLNPLQILLLTSPDQGVSGRPSLSDAISPLTVAQLILSNLNDLTNRVYQQSRAGNP